MNTLRGRLLRRVDDLWFEHSGFTTVLKGPLRAAIEATPNLSEIVIGFRPSSVVLGGYDGGTAEIDTVEPFGKFVLVTARLGENLVKIRANHRREYRRNDRIRLSLRADRMMAFDAETGKALRPKLSRFTAPESPEITIGTEGGPS
jgi:multiple sugar transport system ATP-binding protein